MTAPFRSSPMEVRGEWIDHNGHLNMAYYNVLFDRCIDEIHEALGLGAGYRRVTDASTFTAEAHVVYLRELHQGDTVHVTCQILDADKKRIHSYLELTHAANGVLSAVSEQLHLHVDLKTKRVVPFPQDITDRIAAMTKAHRNLSWPHYIGRIIGIAGRKSGKVPN